MADFEYEQVGEGIRILKYLSEAPIAAVPESIDGSPVTEMGRYAFSGTGIRELELPSSLRKIGGYAFYRCENLKTIRFFSSISDIGAGVFTGCEGVEFLDVSLVSDKKSCVKEVLAELPQTLYVRLGGQNEARVIFPEYYEESIENTPARITGILTHGCGHRYRYCFLNTQFQFHLYDSLFPYAKAEENEALVTELAMCRLQFPWELAPEHEMVYEGYIREHLEEAGRLAAGREPVGDGYMERLQWFCGRFGNSRELVNVMAQEARNAGNPSATSYLMDFSHERFGKTAEKRRKFTL